MAKQNLTPILLIGAAAAAAFFLFKRKTAAREVMTDEGVKVETDMTTESEAPVKFETAPDASGGDNFLSKLVPVAKAEIKTAVQKIKAKRAAKKSVKTKTLPVVKIKAKAAKTKLMKRKRSRMKGFDAMPVLY